VGGAAVADLPVRGAAGQGGGVPDPSVEAYFDHLAAAWGDGSLIRLQLGGPRRRDDDLKQVLARPVSIKAGPRWSVVFRHARRDLTRTLEFGAGVELLRDLLGKEFSTGTLHCRAATWTIEFRPGRAPVLHRHAPAVAAAPAPTGGNAGAGLFPAHDVRKQRGISEDRPWLRALGITGPSGRVLADRTDKFRQIHRYVELLLPMVEAACGAKDGPLRLVDYGCGKGYLAFAAYEALREAFPRRVISVVGVEEREELVAAATTAARASGFDQLTFIAGRIDSVEAPSPDVVVALHACDTATDDALARAVRGGASLVVTAPCCHKELRPQLDAEAPWRLPLSHGILKERLAEWLTDVIRASVLEASGYEARVMEFISPEHTAKNLLLAGLLRSGGTVRPGAHETLRGLFRTFGVKRQALAAHLGFDPAVPTAGDATK
jgi:SAM-dependent methyltransferase